MIAKSNRPVSEISRDLGLDPRRVRKWVERERKERGYLPTEEPNGEDQTLEDAKAEIYRLKKEMSLLQEERDVLKKAISIFSQEHK
jgi:transposase